MQDKVIELVFNRLQAECAGDTGLLKASLGTFIRDCIEAKQSNEKMARTFETQTFVDNYRFDLLDQESRKLLENRDQLVAINTAVAENASKVAELVSVTNQLKTASRFKSVFWTNYFAGILASFTFPLFVLLIAFLIALIMGINFSPISLAETALEWLSNQGGK